MATALETEYCQEYNMTHSIRCTNKFKLVRADGKRVCKRHKNIHTRKCREEGCKKQPVFGTEKGVGLYCSEHKKDGMMNVKDKTCQEDGCKNNLILELKKELVYIALIIKRMVCLML